MPVGGIFVRSDAHNELQDVIKDHFQAMGWIAIKEHCIDGKKIDVLVQNIKTRYTIANEVQLTVKHALENIIRDLNVGCDEVRIISINQKISNRIERRAHRELNKNQLQKVRFQVKEDFIPQTNNNKNRE
jgi:hypothetical protein